jgi:hypothetical protein
VPGDNTLWTQVWPSVVADASKILEAIDIPLIYEDEDSKPLVDLEQGINFNSQRNMGEQFILLPILESFAFCKTARRPYDIAVTAVLLRASMLAKDGIRVR